MQYLLNKTDHRVVPYSEEAAKSGGNDWIRIDAETGDAILADKTGRVVAEFFQKRQLEEANRLVAIARGEIPAEAQKPAEPADPAAAMAAAYAAWANGQSAPLTAEQKQQGVQDAGSTAVQSSATPAQIAALPAPGAPEAQAEPAKTAPPAWGGAKKEK